MSAPRSPGALRLELLLRERGRLPEGVRAEVEFGEALHAFGDRTWRRGWWLTWEARGGCGMTVRAEWLGANEAAATRSILAAGEEAKKR